MSLKNTDLVIVYSARLSNHERALKEPGARTRAVARGYRIGAARAGKAAADHHRVVTSRIRSER